MFEHLQQLHAVAEYQHFISILMPELEKFLEDLPFPAELGVREILNGVPVVVEFEPAIWNHFLEEFEVSLLFFTGVGGIGNE